MKQGNQGDVNCKERASAVVVATAIGGVTGVCFTLFFHNLGSPPVYNLPSFRPSFFPLP